MSVSNPLSRILDTHRLQGAVNYNVWLMNLRILCQAEQLEYVLDRPMPARVSDDALDEERETFKRWKDDDRKVRSYILGSMVPELQRKYMPMPDSGSILLHMRELFSDRLQIEMYRVAVEFFHTFLPEGKPVSPHVLKLIDCIEELERMDIPIDNRLGNTVILASLPKSFKDFTVNFNMHKMLPTYSELHNMLLTAQEDMNKNSSAFMVTGASSSGPSQASQKPAGKKQKKKKKVTGKGSKVASSGVSKPKVKTDVSGKAKVEDGATSKPDFSGKAKVGHMLETLSPAKVDDTVDQATHEKGAKNLSGIGDSGHSVQQAVDEPFDIYPPERGNLMLKSTLLEMNKQKRNDRKRSTDGKSQTILRPGMVLLKNYLDLSDQVNIVNRCRDLGLGPGGFYQPGYRDGVNLHLKMMCLGKNWDPQTSKYSDIRPIDGAKPPAIPAEFYQLVGKAMQDSHALIGEKARGRNTEVELPRMSPDICIANFYSATGKLGLHQDKDESQESIDKGLPVVSFSIGDSAEFLHGDLRDVDNAKKVILESGDVLIFGGKSRRIFHGVDNIIAATAPKSLQEETNIRQGRLNLTFRQY